MTVLRVVVAEDQVLLREGLSRLLTDAGFDVVARSADADDLRRKVAAHRPDVAIVDVQMPPDHTDDGLRAAIEIRRSYPEIGILMLSQFRDEAYALDLIGENAQGVGYLLKDRVADVESFADAVRRVAQGGSALDPEIIALMVGRRRKHDPLEALTAREHQVLALMAEGKSNRGIADSLDVTAGRRREARGPDLRQARARRRAARAPAGARRAHPAAGSVRVSAQRAR